MVAKIKDNSGNFSGEGDDTATVDTTLPPTPVVKFKDDVNDDKIINDKEMTNPDKTKKTDVTVVVTIPDAEKDKLKEGDVITITDNAGNTRKETVTAENIDDIKNNGVEVKLPKPAEGKEIVVKGTITDKAGNTSEGTNNATLDTTPPSKPTVEIVEDNKPKDEILNKEELGDKTEVTVKVTAPSDVKVGDVITVISDTQTDPIKIPVTKDNIDDLKAGNHTEKFPAPENGKTINVVATVTDKAGNTSKEGKAKALRDTSDLSGISVVIVTRGDDHIITNSELDATNGMVKVNVILPADAEIGDTVVVRASGNTSQTIKLTADNIQTAPDGSRFITVAFDSLTDNSFFKATATITDKAGNKGGPAEDYATMDTSRPGKPIVKIIEDKDSDGYIYKSELEGDIDISVVLPAGAKAGQVVYVDWNGDGVADAQKTLTLDDITTGQGGKKNSVSFTMPTPKDANGGVKYGEEIVVIAWVSDGSVKGENSNPARATLRDVCTLLEQPVIVKDSASCSSKGSASIEGYDKMLTYTISPSADIDKESGKITGLVYNTEYIVTVTKDACVKESLPFTISDADLDCDGDGIKRSDENTPEDDTKPCVPYQTPEPTINVVAIDDRVNKEEKEAGIVISGVAKTGVPANDTLMKDEVKNALIEVTVEWGRTTKKAVVDVNGNWKVTFTSNEVPADGDTMVTVRAKHHMCENSVYKKVLVDTIPPPVTINDVKDTDKVVTGRTEPNVKVVVTFPDGTTEETISDENGNWEVPVKDRKIKKGDVIKAVATDDGGNSGKDEEIVVDNTAPSAPIVHIQDEEGESDEYIEIEDLDEDGKVEATITFPQDGGFEEGDVLIVILPDGTKEELPPLTAEDIEKGIAIKFVPIDGAKNTITAVVRDKTGNISSEGEDSSIGEFSKNCDEFLRDLKIPQLVTPNGDGKNDTWEIEALKEDNNCNQTNKIMLFNRLGVKVWSYENYMKEGYKAFNGYSTNSLDFRGSEMLPSGTYFYILELNGSEVARTGYIYIVTE